MMAKLRKVAFGLWDVAFGLWAPFIALAMAAKCTWDIGRCIPARDRYYKGGWAALTDKDKKALYRLADQSKRSAEIKGLDYLEQCNKYELLGAVEYHRRREQADA